MSRNLKLITCFLLLTNIPQILGCDSELIDESFEQINGIISRIETSEILSAKLNQEEFSLKCDFFIENLENEFKLFKKKFGKCLQAQNELKFIQKNLILLQLVCSFDREFRNGLCFR
jgi:hypothetical protein